MIELQKVCFMLGPYHLTMYGFWHRNTAFLLGFDAEISVIDYELRRLGVG